MQTAIKSEPFTTTPLDFAESVIDSYSPPIQNTSIRIPRRLISKKRLQKIIRKEMRGLVELCAYTILIAFLGAAIMATCVLYFKF